MRAPANCLIVRQIACLLTGVKLLVAEKDKSRMS